MRTLANSEDPDEMLHDAAFHQGHDCLLKSNAFQRNKYIFFFKIITCNPSIYTLDHPKFIVSNEKEESISV